MKSGDFVNYLYKGSQSHEDFFKQKLLNLKNDYKVSLYKL